MSKKDIQILPMVALRGVTIFPEMIVHFDVSRSKSIQAVEEAMKGEEKLFLLTQKNAEEDDPDLDDLYKVGTVATVKQVIKMQNGVVRVLVEGSTRGAITCLDQKEPYFKAEVETLSKGTEEKIPDVELEAMTRLLRETFIQYAAHVPKLTDKVKTQILEIKELDKLIIQIVANVSMHFGEMQKMLEISTLSQRCEWLCTTLNKELQIIQIKEKMQEKVQVRIEKNQRDFILREQMKYIQEELGEDTTLEDAMQYEEQLNVLEASKEVKDKIKKEIKRFKSMPANSTEGSMERAYIEMLLELPWDKASADNEDLAKAKKQLNDDHYGLEDVKERVLEFLAVKMLTKQGDSPILCLAGPPGTGKTSIARSIADALNKKYVRVSLGGVKDEAEIRGHRRTYIGAMAGRIAGGLKQAGVKNPLMLLDEIDKLSSDYKGDPSSALLEVLDAEQNYKFRDHYVELPIDLSEVMFLATANDIQGIPRPLLDRMELIEVGSYTQNEKVHIAKEHLMEKQLKKHGLTSKQLVIQKDALEKMISAYTREAGVRQLERKIKEICRKAAKEIFEKEKKKVTVTVKNMEHYLGKEKFRYDMANASDEIGIVRGLAWTSVGGDTLQIEVNIMPGKGEFLLTGQLGDVMKESARTGISYIRSISKQYNIAPDFFKKNDIHIHIPDGAVPKDGPSAGISMATAMLSAITEIPVRADTAMTGEITLRGRVLPIGGLKEKLLAAKNAGVKTVIVPEQNRNDVKELSEEIVGDLEIVYARQMEEVLRTAFASVPCKEKKNGN